MFETLLGNIPLLVGLLVGALGGVMSGFWGKDKKMPVAVIAAVLFLFGTTANALLGPELVPVMDVFVGLGAGAIITVGIGFLLEIFKIK